jgi:hypothetical protein
MAGPKVNPDAQVDGAKPEVKADPGLGKLYATWQGREAANNKLFVQIIEYVRAQKISRSVLKKTLEERGLTPSSVSSEVSRIMGMSKPENAPILQKLATDEITIAAARKAIAVPQERPAKSPVDKVWMKLFEGARIGYAAYSAGDPTFTLEFFVGEATNAWKSVVEEAETKEQEAAEETEEEAVEEEVAVEA